MIKIASLEMTCGACPSQWEGRTDDDRYLYIRYRHGYLSASIGSTMDDAIWPLDTGSQYHQLYCEQLGDDLDGVMGTDEMLGHLDQVISW